MKNLDHKNIIKFYEYFEGENHIYVVLELMKGGELFDKVVNAGYFTEKIAFEIIYQILDVLNYLNDLGIMHRDIKPENLIMADKDTMEVKVSDFGLADFVNNKNMMFKKCGTIGYLAPEVINDQKYDNKVDVYCAGLILYILSWKYIFF